MRPTSDDGHKATKLVANYRDHASCQADRCHRI